MTPARSYLFTSESVSEGHPDKICDQISDAVLDAYLAEEPNARVACESLATTDLVVVAGEVRGPEAVNDRIEEIVRNCVRKIGYEQAGFHWNELKVQNFLHKQSKDIAQGVDAVGSLGEGAGDQGLMFGYAVNETPELMPAPIHYAHRVLQTLAEARRDGSETQLGPDMKSQLTFQYSNGSPQKVTSVVISAQHSDETLSSDDVRQIVEPHVRRSLPNGWIDVETKWFVNPTGKFVIGGPDGDCGLTGRKIVVDTYGGAAPHGGGAFSGKDPTKVDRSGAYAARYLAKNVVAAGLAERCTIQISYAIGVAEPLSLYVRTHKTGKVDANRIEKAVRSVMDLTPKGIRKHLQLSRPIYQRTASYGHFGRLPTDDGEFSWERTDLVEALQRAV